MPFDNTNLPTIVVDLMAGRDYIKRNGWSQDTSNDGQSVCILAAIDFALEEDDQQPRVTAASSALQRALAVKVGWPEGYGLGMAWNDQPGRTLDEVFALYDFAIQRELAASG